MKSMIVNEPPNYRQGGHKVTCAILTSLITWDMHIWIRLFRWVFPNVFHIFPHILRKISTYKQPVKYIPRQANLKFSTSLSKWCSQDSKRRTSHSYLQLSSWPSPSPSSLAVFLSLTRRRHNSRLIRDI